MEMRQFDYPVSFRSLTGTLISEFSSIQYCFSLVLLYRMKILGYSTWSFLLLIVVREDQRTNVGIFLVVCSVSLPIMHLGTGEITTKQVWGPAELPETALGQNAINHLTIIGSLSLVDHSDTLGQFNVTVLQCTKDHRIFYFSVDSDSSECPQLPLGKAWSKIYGVQLDIVAGPF